jgi:hypothetical protein
MSDSTVPPPVMPAMTQMHIHALENATVYAFSEHRRPLFETAQLVRSIVSGEIIPVPRKEIEQVERGMMFKGMTAPYIEAREILRRWLTPDTSKESKE